MDCDLLIIGSGFGGSVCALRAAEAGMRVIVLERGRRMDPAAWVDFESGRMPLRHSPRRAGLFDVTAARGLTALSGCAVGGGSQVYTAVTVPAPAEAFDGWPAGITREAMEPWYRRVADQIAPSPVPAALPRTEALARAASQMGAEAVRLPLAMEWPESNPAARPESVGAGRADGRGSASSRRGALAAWLRGGNTARKRPLDRTYLGRAEEHGAMVRPLCEATVIEPFEGGFQVGCRARVNGRFGRCALTARRVILAAGTLNTVRLLLRCRDRLRTLPRIGPALGRRFSTNGDLGALLVGPRELERADDGPPVTAWIDLWRTDRMFLMETGFIPLPAGGLMSVLEAAGGFWRRGLLRPAPAETTAKTNRPMFWNVAVMGAEPGAGRLLLNRRGRLVHLRDPRPGADFAARRVRRLRELADALGAGLLVPPPPLTRHWPVTLHPLGGAAMADSPMQGVTNPFGEVFGYPGLYVADGSLLPGPTGVAPSMTIAAAAERVVDHLVRAC